MKINQPLNKYNQSIYTNDVLSNIDFEEIEEKNPSLK